MSDTRPLLLGPDDQGTCLWVQGARARRVTPDAAPADAQRIACEGTTLEPGRINAHTHIYSGLAPLGMPAPEPPPENFVQILERVWWRLDRALDADSLRAGARLYVAEALLDGTTTLIDHHESPGLIEGSLDVLAEVCDELGARALLCYGATERNDGRAEGGRGLAECRRFLRTNANPRLTGAVALHASFTVGDETLDEAAALCRELDAVMHVHVAEDAAHAADAVDARARGYDGPLERLLQRGALPPGSIVAHGLDLDAGQIRRAHEEGLWLVQNPRSNHGNRVGYPKALANSDRVALGTDGYPALMQQEVEALREHAHAHGDDPQAVERRVEAGHALAGERFRSVFAMPGAGHEWVAADMVARRPDGTAAHVVVGGKPVVIDGQLVAGDLATIRTQAQSEADALWARMRALPASA